MSVVITGGDGQLGRELQKLYPKADVSDIEELDITDAASVSAYDWSEVELLLNAAAFTNVDAAETDGYEAAWQVNAVGPALLARAARDHDFTIVHVSTDYVFDGGKEDWSENDKLNPLSVYGASKAAGDLAVMSIAPRHYIARTSWVIGDGNNFVKTMLKLAESHQELTVVDDQIGRPTFTPTLASAIKHLVDTGSDFGLYNVSNGGKSISWRQFAESIFELRGLNIEVDGTSTANYFKDKPETATRPLHSTLNLGKIRATGFTPVTWEDNLEEYLKEEE